MADGFIDLRDGDGPGAESFWPSFTDIMMVVLMIFMIASTVLMLRNWDLVRELRATIEAEREAEALALSATRTSATLEERLAQAQHEISELRIRLLRAAEDERQSGRQLVQVRRDLASARQEESRVVGELNRLQEQHGRLARSHRELQAAEAELRKQERARSTELSGLQEQYTESVQQLAALQGDYDELSVKYDKLFKPARTAAGKVLVSVRYRKQGGRDLLEFKEDEQAGYRQLSRKELDGRLTALKRAHPKELYVKVVIPEQSGLSYNEAWTFTQEILTSYDYYYQ